MIFPKKADCASYKTFYNDKGWIVKREYFGSSDKKVLGNEKVEYSYDNRGNEIEMISYRNGKVYEICKSKYNDKNKIIQQDWIDKNGKNEGKYVYIYETDGVTPKRINAISPDGSLFAYMLWNKEKKDWLDPVYSNGNQSSSSWISMFQSTKWPYKWANEVIITQCKISGNTVSLTIKLTRISKYDTGNHDAARKYVIDMKNNLCSQSGGKPSNCTLKMIVIDKANRELFTL